jgi:hypothetical protein
MNKKILLIIFLVALLGVFSFSISNYWLEIKKGQKTPESSLKEISGEQITYIINKGEEDISEYQITEISEDSTVFSLLEELAQKENFEIETTQYDFGVFIESIAGLKNGQDNKYWLYWVNDKLGEFAANKREIKEGDKIEWKFLVPPEFQ